jgi:23S rRNA pseudouridine1911/1915/1917 synthase
VPSSQEEDFEANETTVGKRLDSAVAVFADITRSDAQRIIDGGFVTVDGQIVQKSYKLKAAQRVHVTLPPPLPLEAEPENIPLNIVFEDDDLLVVNKPRGMVVHPAPGNYNGTLVNALLYHCKGTLSGINGVIRPGIVHRIDKDTSGLLLVAKNDCAHLSLAAQIKAHSVNRFYEAVVRGVLKDSNGTIDAPIGRSTKDRKQMAVTDKNSKNAVTHYEIIKQFNKYAYVRLKLETGRTHQIRVHMAHIGHPVAGDPLYGGKLSRLEESLNGQCLHARIIGFVHPRTGKYMEFSSELPEYFTDFLAKAEKL